ncbi:MAG TPA: hypothetical protein VGT41_05905 [Candidatus Babeliales bacterium]|nr:hypothetical protein [Candidatus Babeliales bacterium]
MNRIRVLVAISVSLMMLRMDAIVLQQDNVTHTPTQGQLRSAQAHIVRIWQGRLRAARMRRANAPTEGRLHASMPTNRQRVVNLVTTIGCGVAMSEGLFRSVEQCLGMQSLHATNMIRAMTAVFTVKDMMLLVYDAALSRWLYIPMF